ncbi:MAG: hypothetical protein MJA29_09155, partial [Candidatus Omnitrophica bacterium]|nr:hypothetical protein [Candidatus Omnitrophota bacterium]
MDALFEIISKYKTEYEIILAGDINADHFHRNGIKEVRFRNLLQELNLQDPGSAASFPTYINPHLGHSSRIDHICIGAYDDTLPGWSTPEPLEEDTVPNSSKHLPLVSYTNFKLQHPGMRRRQKDKAPKNIFDFEQADIRKFDIILCKKLNASSSTHASTQEQVTSLQKALTTATQASVPYRRVRPRQSNKKGPKWTPQLKAAIRHSKKCLFRWKKEGRPRGAHPARLEKTKASREVRRIQRRQHAADRQALLQKISTANRDDSVLFHKLIAKQRGSSKSSKAMLIGEKLTTDEEK